MLDNLIIRQAKPIDASAIVRLYQEIYEGTYPDPLMRDTYLLSQALGSSEFCWILALDGETIFGSVAYRIDPTNRVGKSFGAVIDPRYRKSRVAKSMMDFGLEILLANDPPIELIYATTRTVTTAPQRLASSMGYRKLGLFPNVHKTENYETHCLASWYAPGTLEKRFVDFGQHPKVAPLFEICAAECDLPSMRTVDDQTLWDLMATDHPNDPFVVEVVTAPRFVQHRFKMDKEQAPDQDRWFFPFHVPNIVVSSPDQSVEVFAFISEADKHCVIIGIKDTDGRGFGPILEKTTKVLYDKMNARYLEFIIRADEIAKIDAALELHYIPSAYLPALQLDHDKRHDYVIFSRSFEMLDFRNIELDGVNQQYLRQYFRTWKEASLNRMVLD